jgi:hypothetical protein
LKLVWALATGSDVILHWHFGIRVRPKYIHSDVHDAMDGVDAAGACRRAFELDQQVTDALRKTKASVVPT